MSDAVDPVESLPLRVYNLQRELAEAREHLKHTFEELYETQQSLGLKAGQVTLITMQRDRLAEALDKIRRWGCTDGHCSHIAGSVLAAVEGGNDE